MGPAPISQPVDHDLGLHRSGRAGVDNQQVEGPFGGNGRHCPKVRGVDVGADGRVVDRRDLEQLGASQAGHQAHYLACRLDQEIRPGPGQHRTVGAQADVRISAEERDRIKKVFLR